MHKWKLKIQYAKFVIKIKNNSLLKLIVKIIYAQNALNN